MVYGSNNSRMNPGADNNRPGSNSGATNKEREAAPRMAPLMSRRSIITLIIGLAIGIGLGLGYWIISPSFNSSDPTAQAEQGSASPLVWPEFKGPYESTVQIQVVNPGSSSTLLVDLQRTAEYYAAKANTFPFLDYLAQKLSDTAPEFSHTTEELDNMVSITPNVLSDTPRIEIKTVAATEDETLYLAAFIPQVFVEYLGAEEDKLQLEEYETLVQDINDISQALLEAQEDLTSYKLEGVTSNLSNDPTYISLTARVNALQTQLGLQAEQLAAIIATGDQGQAYSDAVTAVERTSTALATARSELDTLEAQHDINYTAQDLAYQNASAKVNVLEAELAQLTSRMTSLLTESTDADNILDYLAVGTPSSPIASIPDRMRQRDAILLGGILGICGAWVALNFKWIVKGMPSTTRREEETA